MTAPTLVGSTFNSAGNSTTSAQSHASGVAQGDLVVVTVHLATDNNLVGTPTVQDDQGTNYGTVTLDADHIDGTKRVLVFSVVATIDPHNGTCSVTMTGTWPSSGNRRWDVLIARPGGTDRWARTSTAGRPDRLARKGTGQTDPGSGNPWGIVVDGSNSGRGQLGIAAMQGPAATYTADWNDDNTYSDSTVYMDLATHSQQSHYAFAASGLLAPHTGAGGLQVDALNFNTGRTTAKALAGVIYEVHPAWTSPARANAACKATAGYSVTRIGQGRANAAAKSTAAGYLNTGSFKQPGRANAAAKATAAGYISVHSRPARGNAAAKATSGYKHTKYGSGRARAASEGFSYQYKISHSAGGRARAASRASARGFPAFASGRANAACKATAGYSVTRKAGGRANVVCHAFAIPQQSAHFAPARARAAAKATAGFSITRFASGRANAAAKADALARPHIVALAAAAATASAGYTVVQLTIGTLEPAFATATLEGATADAVLI
jgi:hypothetical protein